MKYFMIIMAAILVMFAVFSTTPAQAQGKINTWYGEHRSTLTDSTGPWWFGPYDISECVNDSGNFIPWLIAIGNASTGAVTDSLMVYYGPTRVHPATQLLGSTLCVGKDFLVQTIAPNGGVVLATDGTAVTSSPALTPAATGLSVKFLPRYAWVQLKHIAAASNYGNNYVYFEFGCIKASAATQNYK